MTPPLCVQTVSRKSGPFSGVVEKVDLLVGGGVSDHCDLPLATGLSYASMWFWPDVSVDKHNIAAFFMEIYFDHLL